MYSKETIQGQTVYRDNTGRFTSEASYNKSIGVYKYWTQIKEIQSYLPQKTITDIRQDLKGYTYTEREGVIREFKIPELPEREDLGEEIPEDIFTLLEEEIEIPLEEIEEMSYE